MQINLNGLSFEVHSISVNPRNLHICPCRVITPRYNVPFLKLWLSYYRLHKVEVRIQIACFKCCVHVHACSVYAIVCIFVCVCVYVFVWVSVCVCVCTHAKIIIEL